MNPNYIADQITRIETRFANNPKAIEDSLWRIASNADLFEEMPQQLTNEQRAVVQNFINSFKSTPQGQSALKELR